jgi:hypothetical protein
LRERQLNQAFGAVQPYFSPAHRRQIIANVRGGFSSAISLKHG